LNLRPLACFSHYGTAWKIVDLLGFTREDLTVHFGVYRVSAGPDGPVSGRILAVIQSGSRTDRRCQRSGM
jgi:hypothetical protein